MKYPTLVDTFEGVDRNLSGEVATSGHIWADGAGTAGIVDEHLTKTSAGAGTYANVDIGNAPKSIELTFKWISPGNDALLIITSNPALENMIHFRVQRTSGNNYNMQHIMGEIGQLPESSLSAVNSLVGDYPGGDLELETYYTYRLDFFHDKIKITLPDGTKLTADDDRLRMQTHKTLTIQCTGTVSDVRVQKIVAVPANRVMIA